MTNPIKPVVDKVKDILSPHKDKSTSIDPLSAATGKNMAKFPKTCKAAVCEKPGENVVLKDVELQEPKGGEILIKSQACGVCFSDFATIQGHMGPMAKFPLIPGHEVIGTVVAVGPGEKVWKEGDRVGGAWHGGHDGTCRSCKRGLFQMCDNELVNGVSKNGGCKFASRPQNDKTLKMYLVAEYCTLRSEAAVRIPKDVNAAEFAPLLCAGVTTFNGMRRLNITAGDIVAVQGLGGLGHLAIQYARKMGFRTVALSSSGSKRDFAHQLGANEYVDGSKEDTAEALQKMGGACLIIVTAPNPQIIGPLINGLAPHGKLLILAPVGDVPVNTGPLILKGLSVHGWPSGHALDAEEAIAFAENQGVKCMVETFPLEKVQDALDHMTSGKVRFRSVLTME